MSTSSVPTGAISPSGTKILSTVPAYGDGNLDGRLVGLDLDERIVLGDLLPLGDEPARHLALRESLARGRAA